MENYIFLDNLLAMRWADAIECAYHKDPDIFCKKCDNNMGSLHICNLPLQKQVLKDPNYVATKLNINWPGFVQAMQHTIPLEDWAVWRAYRPMIHDSFLDILTLVINVLYDRNFITFG